MTDLGRRIGGAMFDEILILAFIVVVSVILIGMIILLVASFGLLSIPVLAGLFAVVMVGVTLFD